MGAQRIATEHDEIREFAAFDRAFLALFKGRMGAMQCLAAQRFLDRDALPRAPDVPFHIGARNRRLQRHHRLEWTRRIIRSGRNGYTGVEKTAKRKHVIEPFGAVLAEFLAVVVDVGREWRRDRTDRFDALDE